jgi:outer membrane protein OmpA-like peptidoglycan-associated protein/tetratricopeptide (TPR) repeat protein
MKRPLLLIWAFILVLMPAVAQKSSQNLKQLFLDAEYFFLNEDFEEALYSYNTISKRGNANNANINYRIGQCYLNIPGEKDKAIDYLLKATSNVSSRYVEGAFKETKAPFDAWFFLGNAYRIDNQLDKAIDCYAQFKQLIGPKNVVGNKIAENAINACDVARSMMKSPVFIKTKNLGRPVNTTNRDYFPVVSGDESVLVYNSALKFYQAVFFSKKVNGKWSSPANITAALQSDGDQYVSSLSFDGTELYLRKEDNFEANLMVSKYEKGKWTKSKPLNHNINTKFFEGNCSVSKDGLTLFFSSNRSGTVGAMDIFKSERKPTGDWGPAINLGKVINTEFNEDAPFISEDGKRLYFSSQGHNTMGGYDIFYSELGADGQWQDPVNLGYPINTTDDNQFFYPIKNGKVAYLGMFAKDGYGKDDIVRIQLAPGNDEAIAEQPDEIKKDSGLIAKGKEPVKRELPPDVEKALTQGKSETQKTSPETQKEIDNLVLRSFFFEFNSSEISERSKKELDHLSLIMENIPELRIELTGNTDAKGNDAYNNLLSVKRASNAKAYLIKKGIKSARILVKGVGKSNFIALNNNPDGSDNSEGRKYNRRVDVEVLNGKAKEVKIEKIDVPESLKIK